MMGMIKSVCFVLACLGSVHPCIASMRRLDQPNFKHKEPEIKLFIDDICPGQPFNGTVKVIGAGGANFDTPPMDVVFVIDVSFSMNGSKMEATKAAVSSFVDNMAENATESSMAGILAIHGELDEGIDKYAWNLLNLTADYSSVLQRVDELDVIMDQKFININLALEWAIKIHDDSSRPASEDPTKVIILLSDGDNEDYTKCFNNTDQIDPNPESFAYQAHNKNITIYSIGVGNTDAKEGMIDMANCTNGNSYLIQNDAIEEIFGDIYQTIEESTIPYNINVKLVPKPFVQDIKFLDFPVSLASKYDLLNVDNSKGLSAGNNISIHFTGVIAEGAIPSSLVEPNSTYESGDKGGTDLESHTLSDLGNLKMDPNCVPTPVPTEALTPMPNPGPTLPPSPNLPLCNCLCLSKSTKSSRSTKSSKSFTKTSKYQGKSSKSTPDMSRKGSSGKSGKRALNECSCSCSSITRKHLREHRKKMQEEYIRKYGVEGVKRKRLRRHQIE